MLATLVLTGSEHWAPFNFSQTTELMNVVFIFPQIAHQICGEQQIHVTVDYVLMGEEGYRGYCHIWAI